jgi:hypothetical protein
MIWRDDGEYLTKSDCGWKAEFRRGLWWLYLGEAHVGTQISKQAAQKLAKRKSEEAPQ